MKASIHQPNYLPYLGILNKIKNSDIFVIYDVSQYVKGRFDNRNLIKTATGTQWLTIPLVNKDSFLKKICDVKLPLNENWKKDHLKAMKINYNKSKFFEKYFPELSKIYKKKYTYFTDFSTDLLLFHLKSFQIKTPTVKSSDLGLDLKDKSSRMIIQILKKINSNEYLAGSSGKKYMDVDLLKKSNIKVIYQHFEHPIYKQLFQMPFVKNLAAIDLLFNEGPKASELI